MSRLLFTSSIPAQYKEQLIEVFFFNDNQGKYREQIIQAVDLYSKPVIRNLGSRVALDFENEGIGQALHLVYNTGANFEVLGGFLYTRDPLDTLRIVHMAFSQQNLRVAAVDLVLMQMKKIASVLRGIRYVFFQYNHARFNVRNLK